MQMIFVWVFFVFLYEFHVIFVCVCVCVFVCGLIRAEKVAGWNIFSLRWPATAACHRNSNPHRKAWPLSLPPQFTLPTQAGESLQSITAKQYTHTHTHTHTHTRAIIKWQFIFHMFLFESVWATQLQMEATWLKYLCYATQQSIY